MTMTSVDLPDGLVEQAMQSLGAATKREAIIKSLEATVRRERQAGAVRALGGMPWIAALAEPEFRADARR